MSYLLPFNLLLLLLYHFLSHDPANQKLFHAHAINPFYLVSALRRVQL
jgi:hypothetical protein